MVCGVAQRHQVAFEQIILWQSSSGVLFVLCSDHHCSFQHSRGSSRLSLWHVWTALCSVISAMLLFLSLHCWFACTRSSLKLGSEIQLVSRFISVLVYFDRAGFGHEQKQVYRDLEYISSRIFWFTLYSPYRVNKYLYIYTYIHIYVDVHISYMSMLAPPPPPSHNICFLGVVTPSLVSCCGLVFTLRKWGVSVRRGLQIWAFVSSVQLIYKNHMEKAGSLHIWDFAPSFQILNRNRLEKGNVSSNPGACLYSVQLYRNLTNKLRRQTFLSVGGCPFSVQLPYRNHRGQEIFPLIWGPASFLYNFWVEVIWRRQALFKYGGQPLQQNMFVFVLFLCTKQTEKQKGLAKQAQTKIPKTSADI